MKHTLAGAGAILVAAFVIGLYLSRVAVPAQPSEGLTAAVSSSLITGTPVEYRENSSAYRYINPLLFIETDQRLYPEYDDYDSKLASYIRSTTSSGRADSVSVYLRDLNSGHWTGVNVDEKYEPSSMLKIVVAIAVLRNAVNSASMSSSTVTAELSKQVYYPGTDNAGQYYVGKESHDPGMYSISDIMDMMIKESDNQAMFALLSNDTDEFNQAYNDFRLPMSSDNGASDYMTARSFSVVFRTLYNSTYLSNRISDELLQLLTETEFDQGLVAGVPNNVTVAHKFGEHTNLGVSGLPFKRELHDCGIVYYPGSPYLLCVMTKGQDLPTLASVISAISKMTYMYVDNLSLSVKSR